MDIQLHPIQLRDARAAGRLIHIWLALLLNMKSLFPLYQIKYVFHC